IRRERRPRHPPNNPQSWSNGWVRIQCKSWVRIPRKSTIGAFALSWKIPRRDGFDQDCWGPTRGFSKIRDSLQGKVSKSTAAFLTEAISGFLHAPLGFFFLLLVTKDAVQSRWAAGVVLAFWLGLGVGRALIIENQSKRKALKDPVEAFLRDPLHCLKGYQSFDVWREARCDDIYVKSLNKPLGYVQQITIDTATGVASIGHFAVEKGLERKGIGRRLALTLRAELAWRYGVKQIVFKESSTRYEEAKYEDFFKNLGAQMVPPDQFTKSGRNDWVWTC
ncbi:MAG: GNAT family N-acetyltransferase, partial [Paraburkholderia sp.]|uniref:GNAT family N-acetyltransferase n=1 Tax=Paraburkholderia sp. TaxID=1926495 RepID=UPI0039783BF0